MKNKLLLAFLSLSIALTSCKKNKGDEPSNQDPFKLGYSNLTVEENKKDLENSGIDFIQKVNSLPDEKFIKVLKNLNNLDLELQSNGLKQINGFAEGASNKSITKILENTSSNDVQRLSDNYGIYTYNSVTKKWTKTSSSSKLEINFPAYENGTLNNAKITMTYAIANLNTTLDNQNLELPKLASAILLVDNVEEMKFTSANEYKADGTPTKSDISLSMGTFSLAFNISNNTEVLTNSFSFSKGTETLFSFNSTVNGKLNVGTVNASEDAADVIKNANANFEIMNIKFSGIFDVKGFSDEQKGYQNLASAQDRNSRDVLALNKYSQFVAINKTTNSIIAKTEFVTVANEYCYTNWYNNQQICNTNYDWEPRLKFKDDSKLSFEAFKENGFAKLIDDINAYDDRF
jgi:hypothetical protein